jgi:hypothetical protein
MAKVGVIMFNGTTIVGDIEIDDSDGEGQIGRHGTN